MTSEFGAYEQAKNLAEKYVSHSDRILLIGATGWFGRTFLSLLQNVEPKFLLISSSEQQFSIGKKRYKTQQWNESEIQRFAPTIVIDCAFLTRDFLASMPLEQYLSTNQQLMKNVISMTEVPSVERIITISSGAAAIAAENPGKSLQEDPYGILKLQLEELLAKNSKIHAKNLVVARAWSVSGSLVRNPQNYAFSDLILQARTSQVIIKSSHEVWRRYCAAEEFLALALAISKTESRLFNSGGELVEIQTLADLVINEVNPSAKLSLRELTNNKADSYYSDNSDWSELCREYGLETLNIAQQIRMVSKGIK